MKNLGNNPDKKAFKKFPKKFRKNPGKKFGQKNFKKFPKK